MSVRSLTAPCQTNVSKTVKRTKYSDTEESRFRKITSFDLDPFHQSLSLTKQTPLYSINTVLERAKRRWERREERGEVKKLVAESLWQFIILC